MLQVLIPVTLIYITGKGYHGLAHRYQKSKELYAFIGALFLAAGFFAGQGIFYLAFTFSGTEFIERSQIRVIGLLSWLTGVALAWFMHKVFKSKWHEEELKERNNKTV